MKSKTTEYRQTLILWAEWWNNIGRYYYTHSIIPPIKATHEALSCLACSGINIDDECLACGRTPNE